MRFIYLSEADVTGYNLVDFILTEEEEQQDKQHELCCCYRVCNFESLQLYLFIYYLLLYSNIFTYPTII